MGFPAGVLLVYPKTSPFYSIIVLKKEAQMWICAAGIAEQFMLYSIVQYTMLLIKLRKKLNNNLHTLKFATAYPVEGLRWRQLVLFFPLWKHLHYSCNL